MPVAEIRSSAKDEGFVHFIVELRVYTQMYCFFILFCIYRGFYSLFRNGRFISLLFFFFPSYVQSAYMIYFLQSFVLLPCRSVSKYCISVSNRPSALGKTAKTKIQMPRLWHKVYRDSYLLRDEILFHLICIKNQYGVQLILHLLFLCCKTKMSEIPL